VEGVEPSGKRIARQAGFEDRWGHRAPSSSSVYFLGTYDDWRNRAIAPGISLAAHFRKPDSMLSDGSTTMLLKRLPLLKRRFVDSKDSQCYTGDILPTPQREARCRASLPTVRVRL
jgi:hypothetical protein